MPPIGLGLIATELKANGFDVELIDAVALNIPLETLIQEIEGISPEFICINVFSTNIILVREFVESLKINTHFIIGGLSTKDLQAEIFSWNSNKQIDCVHGDGEKIIVDILLNNLRQLPTFELENRRFFKVDSTSVYYVHDISNDNLDRKFFVNEPIPHPFGFLEATIVTSRGCIYNCAFCAAAQSVNRSQGIREKNAESIIREIHHLIEIYPGLQSIRVLDDLFLKNAKTIEKAIQIFSKFNLQWRGMAHVETFKNIHEETIRKLKESGCNELFIGLESGSPKILKQIHKCHDLNKIQNSVAMLLRNGINVKGYFIYGFPGETQEDFEMTFELAKYLHDTAMHAGTEFRTSVFQYRPYHGTELFHSIDKNEVDAVKKICLIEPNVKLSELIGRLQFNFHSGNYSNEEVSVVQSYIVNTTKLNSLRILGSYDRPNEFPKQN